MAKAIEEAKKMLLKMPKNSTWNDITYAMYVRQKVEKGMKDFKEGHVFTQAEVERQSKKWFAK